MTTIAVLGTGTLGAPVARNLARAGFDVSAWNRTRAKAEPLSADGVTVERTVADAVADAAVVITLLADGDAVVGVVEDGAAATRSGALWIQASTVGIEATERLAEIASEHGLVFVDAPVLGTKEPAERGELVVFASGPQDAQELCEPIFGAIGKATRWVGEAGAGQRFKLVVNTWLLAAVQGVAETISLSRGLDLDPDDVLDALSGGPLDMPYLQLKGKVMIRRDFEPSFKASLAEKDAGLVLEAAEGAGLELPLVEAVRDAFAQAVELGHADEDMAAVVEASAVALPPARAARATARRSEARSAPVRAGSRRRPRRRRRAEDRSHARDP